MSYAFISAKSQLDKRTLGGTLASPIPVEPSGDAAGPLADSFLELGLPTREIDGSTSYGLEVNGEEVGLVRGAGRSWHFVDQSGARSAEDYRSRKLASSALAVASIGS